MNARHPAGDSRIMQLGGPDSLLLLSHNGALKGNLWSSSQYSANNAWNVNNNGNTNNNNKYNGLTVVPLSELNHDTKANRYHIPLSHILAAFDECVKNKAKTYNAQRFVVDFEHNIMRLWREVNSGTYKIGRSICFIVNRPIKREVFAADFRDRIVHDYICMRINPLLEAYLPDNMCSNRTNKGTLYAIHRVADDVMNVSRGYANDCYICKFDIRGFFMSIDKPLLNEKVQRFIDERYDGKDAEPLKWLTEMVILNCPQKHCVRRSKLTQWDGLRADKSLFTQDDRHGMPIGNLPSQLLANFLLSDVIRFVKESGFSCITQYVDDFVLVHESRDEIRAFLPRLRAFLKDHLGLELHTNKTYLQHYRKGVSFVGGIIKPYRIYTSSRTRRKMEAKMWWLAHKANLKPQEALASVNSYLGLTRHFSAYRMRERAARLMFERYGNAVYFNENYHKMIIAK